MEKYLVNLDPFNRITLGKFCCNHKLPIVAGQSLEANIARSCTMCESGPQCDDSHYTSICSALNTDKVKFIKPYYYRRPNTFKMNQLFNIQSIKMSHLRLSLCT